jgi:hypothetical protein
VRLQLGLTSTAGKKLKMLVYSPEALEIWSKKLLLTPDNLIIMIKPSFNMPFKKKYLCHVHW